MFINHHVFYMYAFSDYYICRDHAVLYNSARFDDTASSDDGILDGSLDQASVGHNRGGYLAAVKIFCR